MSQQKNIIIKTQFPALHAWKDCPIKDVEFLKHPHRHVFYVTVKIPVIHNNRQIEFFIVKRSLEEHIRKYFYDQYLGGQSCEDICESLSAFIQHDFGGCSYISVMEDNENGAEINFKIEDWGKLI